MKSLLKRYLVLVVTLLIAPLNYASEKKRDLAINNVSGDLSVMVLGSGGAIATKKGRASSGYLIFTDGKPRILMDVGGGTLPVLLKVVSV
ncbi:MAG: hypothetical protein COB30_010330 [Ectothiorhodospiraceae bacterium]|nr:hypothetical protein [Ectothiorhodospiraceae bacterium]